MRTKPHGHHAGAWAARTCIVCGFGDFTAFTRFGSLVSFRAEMVSAFFERRLAVNELALVQTNNRARTICQSFFLEEINYLLIAQSHSGSVRAEALPARPASRAPRSRAPRDCVSRAIPRPPRRQSPHRARSTPVRTGSRERCRRSTRHETPPAYSAGSRTSQHRHTADETARAAHPRTRTS